MTFRPKYPKTKVTFHNLEQCHNNRQGWPKNSASQPLSQHDSGTVAVGVECPDNGAAKLVESSECEVTRKNLKNISNTNSSAGSGNSSRNSSSGTDNETNGTNGGSGGAHKKLRCPAPISRLRVEKIEGGLMVAGVVVAANCQIILPIFGFLFLLVGCVLTGHHLTYGFTTIGDIIETYTAMVHN